MTTHEWKLENPQHGQECVVIARNGTFVRSCNITNMTSKGRIRCDDGGLYSAETGRRIERWSQTSITNDEKAIMAYRQHQAEQAERVFASRRKQVEREADPRWPVAGQMNWSLSHVEWFDRLAVLTPDELAQLSALLTKIQEP